jgi:hypothetical protein
MDDPALGPTAVPLAVAVPDASQMSVVVPPGAIAGQSLEIQAPGSAQRFTVSIPPGVEPGQSFLVNIPRVSVVPMFTVTSVAVQYPAGSSAQTVLNHETNSGVFSLYNQARWVKIFAFLDFSVILIVTIRDSKLFLMHTLLSALSCPLPSGLYFGMIFIIMPIAGIQGARKYSVQFIYAYMFFLFLEVLRMGAAVVQVISSGSGMLVLPLLNAFVNGYILYLTTQLTRGINALKVASPADLELLRNPSSRSTEEVTHSRVVV